MNGEDVKRSLGVDPTLTFEACKADVNKDFALQADAMQNSALLLTDLVNEGVRLLVYAGNAGQSPQTTLETPFWNPNVLDTGHRRHVQLHGQRTLGQQICKCLSRGVFGVGREAMGHKGVKAQGRHDPHSRRAGINSRQCHVRQRV